MTYWRTYYHVVWTTKYRVPLITPDIETVIFPSIAYRAQDLGAILYALNGTEDHVHLATAIPPRIAVAQLIGELKGRSSFIAGHKLNVDFAWQSGYGVHTFGEKHLPWVIEYVRRQKEHHAAQTTRARLEICAEDEDGPSPAIPDRAVDGPSDE